MNFPPKRGVNIRNKGLKKNWVLTLPGYPRCEGKLRPWRQQPIRLCLGIPMPLRMGRFKDNLGYLREA
uniref:Uncharacterized protein n=1 Tax=Moorena producens (strain JHB) TaxID=1454205 RepID=A0A1D9FYS8_MOOP1